MVAYKLAKGIIVFFIYIISRLFCLYSRLNRCDTPRNLELTYIVPFKYMFLTRLGEAYIVESALFRRYYDIAPLRLDSVVIDVGAHIGTFTVRASRKIAGKGLVIAIEPEPSNAWHLVINLSVNKCKNVKVIRAACSDRDGYDFLYLHGFTGHSIVLHSKERIPVRTLCLDTLTSTLKRLSGSDLKISIKMNAEGAELRILRGATETLRYCNVIVVAAHHYPHQARDVGVFLRKMGFITKVIEEKGNRLVIGLRA
jgi:FkbM family methyltransferase